MGRPLHLMSRKERAWTLLQSLLHGGRRLDAEWVVTYAFELADAFTKAEQQPQSAWD